MFSRGGFDAKSRRKLSGTEAAVDTLVALANDNPDKALVMTYIGQLVADGFAVWDKLDNGEIKVLFASGLVPDLSRLRRTFQLKKHSTACAVSGASCGIHRHGDLAPESYGT